jgi:cell division protein FtsL
VEEGRVMARKSRFGKRSLIALGLTIFVVVAFIVVWRRSLGVSRSQDIARMETRKTELETERKTLEDAIREASSNARIEPAARGRLNMHTATETEVRYFSRDPRDARSATDSTDRP